MKELEGQLKVKEINPTAMRLVVLDFMLKQTKAVSLNDIEMGLHRTDRITLYRTIRTFEEKGLVHRIEDGSGSTKFAICQSDCATGDHHDLHVHFYCNECRETFCLPKTQIPHVELPDKYLTQEVGLTVKGICSSCNN